MTRSVTPPTAGKQKYTLPPRLPGASAQLIREFERVVRDISDFSQHVGDSMRNTPKEASRFVQECVVSTAILFQKWNLEILYLLALQHTLRFSELKNALTGISSRTLSLKLDELERQGLLNRAVQATKPLRVDYSLTDDGRTMARLTVPLVVFLNLQAGLSLEPDKSG
jgi:DNA-binding HxlR family transcriptional regulator